ncbi:4Fe-4S dicluster domain-containing protein [Zhaonella formicivorans]|uniref:4Fe-4S dicluster domain-containing protein n=1 Tax=Zhaonella formicivorans TaxID=2528593 RepID=UPI0010F40DD9|nr:4Fe-4S binding protein [Zhaonella formicivorans]
MSSNFKVNEQCNGCGLCVEICPMDVLRMNDDNKPYMKYDECWYCDACEKDCPMQAITVEIPYLVR